MRQTRPILHAAEFFAALLASAILYAGAESAVATVSQHLAVSRVAVWEAGR